MDNTTEETFLAGSENAFELLVNEYSPQLLRYCYGILGNYDDAQDVVQMIMVKLYYKRQNIQFSIAVKSYLYKLAYNSCIDVLRKSKRDKLLQDKYMDNLLLKGEAYDNTMQAKNLISEKLQIAFSKLKPEDRALVYEIVVEEKSYSEITYIFDKSESVLRKRYERARKKLQELLNKTDKGQHN